MSKNKNLGFIALTSVIILSVLLIIITAALSFANYFGQYNILNNELKQKTYALGEGCLNYAIMRSAGDQSYNGNECIKLANNFCKIISVSTGAFPKTIITQSVVQKNYSNSQAIIGPDLKIIFEQEAPQITTSSCQ